MKLLHTVMTTNIIDAELHRIRYMIGASSRIESGRNVYGIRLHKGYGRNNTSPDLIQYQRNKLWYF